MNRRGFKRTIVTVQTDRFLHYGAFWTMSFPKFGKRAVTSLLSYASEECMDITPIFVSSGTIRSLNVPCGEIKYFEDGQIRALLDSSGKEKRPSGACRHLPHCLSCYL